MQDAESLLADADVLVVGAGPAGSAAAIELARAGRSVVLIDQHEFPRDKVCGDGLIPDALQALDRLGILGEVMALAQRATGVAAHGPSGGTLHIPGNLAVLPRKQLDHILVRAAVASGARLVTPARYLRPLTARGRAVGAQVLYKGQTRTIRSRWTVLATGGTVRALKASGHCTQGLPSAMALRVYVRNPGFDLVGERLNISWHRAYSPGYGWVFHCGGDVFNLGVGIYGLHDRHWRDHFSRWPGFGCLARPRVNLNQLFAQFVSINPLARDLMATGSVMGEPKGAPLRCSLSGAVPAQPGVLVAGEAIGSTYALTGEGIGKAMETGLLAAAALLQDRDDAAIVARYRQSLAELQPKFTFYQRANLINQMPWLIDLAIRRGNRSPQLVQRMSRVLEEKANPARLFTLRGAWKFLTE